MTDEENRFSTQTLSLRERAELHASITPTEVSEMTTDAVQQLVNELHIHQVELDLQNEELRHFQLELAESHDRYTDLYDFAPVGYVSLDRDGDILEANLAAAALLHIERDDMLHANINRFLNPDAQDVAWLHRQEVLVSGRKQACELSMKTADSNADLVVRFESIASGSEPRRHCRTALIDMTGVKRAQQLQESEHRYRRLTDAVTDYIYRVRVESGHPVETAHCANCEAVTGYTPEEFVANPLLWIAMVPTEDRVIVKRQATCILSGEVAAPIEHRIRRKDGQIRWVLNTASPQRNEHGDLIGYDGLLRDITERKEAENSLRQLNETLEQRVAEQTREVTLQAEAMASLGEGVMITTDHLMWPGPQIVYVNEAMCRISGYTSDELIGQTPHILDGEQTDKQTIELLRQELSEKRSVACELISYRKSGTPYDAEIFITPLFDSQGNHTNFIVIHRDVTERKRAERELHKSTERLRAILNTAADAIITIDQRGIIETVNPAIERMFGYAMDELIGLKVSMLMPPPQCDEHDDYVARHLATGEARIIGTGREVVAQRRDGSTFPVDLAISEIDHLGLFIAVVRDITERHEAQHQLLQAERLSAIGEAMAGLAHESRNALQRSQACLDLLTEQLENRPESLELLESIQRAQDDLHHLYEEVRVYAAPVCLRPQYCHVGEIMRQTWGDMSAARYGRTTRLAEQGTCDDLNCEVDAFAIGQVFRNVLENALQACSDPVEIQVDYSEVNQANGRALAVVIRDNGPGILTPKAERVFDSFFTTKTEGTGLGMAIAQRIVQAHGGNIAVNPDCEQGAEFVVTLPRMQP